MGTGKIKMITKEEALLSKDIEVGITEKFCGELSLIFDTLAYDKYQYVKS